jgi:plastocyanin
MPRRAGLIAALPLALTVLAAGCSGTGGAGGVSASFDGATATLEAVNIQFEPDTLTLPAGQPLRIVLDNRDAGVPHDVHVFQGDTDIATSPVVTGPGQTEVRFGPLAPDRYTFQCTIHPDMIGTVIVTP